MNIIFKEILFQKLKTKPNRKFIRRLQTYVDKTDEMTLDDFQSFGRFIPRERFLDSQTEFLAKIINSNYTSIYSSEEPHFLRDDCTDVVVYLGGLYIQALKNNTFYKQVGEDSVQSDNIKDVEEFYWEKHVSKYKKLNYGKD